MIIKGGAAGNVGWWSKHLLRDDTNEKAEIKEIRGLNAETLRDALWEMKWVAAGSKSQGNFMYQANVNPRADEQLTPEQWQEAVDTLEKNMGFEGHQRVVIEHVKDGRQHYHVIWNRVDVETMKVADIGGNYRIHEATARGLEQRFDHTPTPSPVPGVQRTGEELWEKRAAERSGIDPAELKAELTELWRASDSGQAFRSAIEERGYILARGDRRDFCVIDAAGDAHSLARRLEGVKAADVRAYMADVDRENLPTVADGRGMQDARAARVSEIKTIEDGKEYVRLYRGIGNNIGQAAVGEAVYFTADKATAAAYGDVHVVDVSLRDMRKFVPSHEGAPIQGPIKPSSYYDWITSDAEIISRLQPLAGDRAAEVETFWERRLRENRTEARETDASSSSQFEADREGDSTAGRDRGASAGPGAEARHQGSNRDDSSEASRAGRDASGAAAAGEKASLGVFNAAAGGVEKVADFVAEFLAGGGAEPKTARDFGEEQADRIEAQRKALAALAAIRESIQNGQTLRPEDLKNLTPNHLANIAAKGDSYLLDLIRRWDEEERERAAERGRERER